MFPVMKKLARVFAVVLVCAASYPSQALVLSVTDEKMSAQERVTTGGTGALIVAAGIGAMGVGIGAGVVAIVFGVYLDGNQINPQQLAQVDPVRHLKDLMIEGIYNESDGQVIIDELQSMQFNFKVKLQSIGCPTGARTCNISLADYQRAFELSPKTVQYLFFLSGVQ